MKTPHLIAAMISRGLAAPAVAQSAWVKVGTYTYPGGTVRADLPFAVDVETRQIAIDVAAYCAPRAVASRAVVLESDPFGTWTRTVPPRFVRQERVGGYLHAFYAVGATAGGDAPWVTGVQFSFAPATPYPATRACRLDFYALPAAD